MIEPLGDQDYGFMSFVLLLVYAIQDLRGKPDGLDPSVFFADSVTPSGSGSRAQLHHDGGHYCIALGACR